MSRRVWSRWGWGWLGLLAVACGGGAAGPADLDGGLAAGGQAASDAQTDGDAAAQSGGGAQASRDAEAQVDALADASIVPHADASNLPETLAFCVERCVAPSDCATSAASVDADNWACEDGACRYLGCLSDAECDATFGGAVGAYRCVDGGAGLRQCVEACATREDCATAGAPSLDADNWACETGACRYQGCNDDAECTAAFAAQGGTWRCVDFPGAQPACVEACETRDDCASPAASVDADNYACAQGLCQYLGCISDAECQETFSAAGGSWACR